MHTYVSHHALWLLSMLSVGCRHGAEHRQADAQAQASEPVPTQPVVVAAGASHCGSKGQPDCPLQHWMKTHVETYQRDDDQERLARAFHELAEHAPEGYERWRELALHGAQSTNAEDIAGVKRVCKECHELHRARYRRERRALALW